MFDLGLSCRLRISLVLVVLMNLLKVSVEVLLPAEPRLAQLALERLDVAVRHDVELQLVEPVELLGAAHVVFKRALVLLNIAVYERMSF